MRRFFLLALVLVGGPAYPAVFHVVATGHSFMEYNNPLGLLPFPEPAPDTPFTLTFDYDAATWDSRADPGVGIYGGAISRMSLTIDGASYPGLADSRIVVLDRSADGSDDLWLGQTYRDDAGVHWEMSLVLIGLGPNRIQSDALGAPTLPGPWYLGVISYSIEDQSDPDPNNWVQLADSNVMLDNVAVSEVPVPPAGFLAAGFLPLARFVRRDRLAAVTKGA